MTFPKPLIGRCIWPVLLPAKQISKILGLVSVVPRTCQPVVSPDTLCTVTYSGNVPCHHHHWLSKSDLVFLVFILVRSQRSSLCLSLSLSISPVFPHSFRMWTPQYKCIVSEAHPSKTVSQRSLFCPQHLAWWSVDAYWESGLKIQFSDVVESLRVERVCPGALDRALWGWWS